MRERGFTPLEKYQGPNVVMPIPKDSKKYLESHRKHSSFLTGFTFIELLIVTTIIAILAAYAIPRFRSSYDEFRIRGLADRLTWLAQAAHELAMSEGRIYKIALSQEPKSFILLREPDEGNEFTPLSGGAGKRQTLPEEYELKSDLDEILFYPDGSATPCEIAIEARRRRLVIELDAHGKVAVR